MKNGFVIAIDGPVASGKGTIARKLSQKIDAFYLHSGAMYRVVALLVIRKNLNLFEEVEVESVFNDFDINLIGDKIFIKNEDVTSRIIEPDTSEGASVVGVYPKVRKFLVSKQRQIGQEYVARGQIVVAEGRDMGTVVFPDARFKFFLTADFEIRARRRFEDYQKRGINKTLSQIIDDLKIRDERDTYRKLGALSNEPERDGYVVVDSSAMSVTETLETIWNKIKEEN